MHPHHSLSTVPALDVLVHPGGDGANRLTRDPGHLSWVRRERERVPLVTSVCTGALVLAAAGLLRRRPATTNRSALGAPAELDPTVEVRPNVRYVDDGNVVTSAGISAGIEPAPHIVGPARLTRARPPGPRRNRIRTRPVAA